MYLRNGVDIGSCIMCLQWVMEGYMRQAILAGGRCSVEGVGVMQINKCVYRRLPGRTFVTVRL